jgi:plasmid maintenance system antidote protein VapI
MADEFKGLSNEALRNVQGVRDAMRDVDLAVRNVNKEFIRANQSVVDVTKELNNINTSARKFADLQDQASRSAKTTSDAIKEQQKQLNIVRSLNVRIDDLYREASKTTNEASFNLKRQAENLANARDNAKSLADEYTKLAEDSSALDKSSRFFTGLSKIVSDIPILRQFSTPFEAAAEAARKTTVENAKNAGLNERLDKFKQLRKQGIGIQDALKETNLTAKDIKIGKLPSVSPLQAGFKALGPIISQAFKGLGLVSIAVEAFKLFVQLSFAADKRITDIAKNLSLSKDAAVGIYSNILATKGTLDTSFATTQNIVDAFNELTQLTEFVNISTTAQLETQIKLTKELGLSVDEALALQSIFAVNNTEADQGLDIINDQIAAFANENKLLADSSKITKQISATNKLILLNFRGNTAELTRTVLQANKLGLSLDQVSKVADSLLNFEQSISAELSAELLTGRRINLEKARLFALNNDIAGVTQEIANQGITAEKFARMNRIQQQAIAETLGMQANELGDALYKQQLIDKTAQGFTKRLREQADLTERRGNSLEAIRLRERAAAIEQGILQGKSLEESKAQVDAQQKFNLALERAKELFTDFVGEEGRGPLAKLVDYLERIVNDLEKGKSLGEVLFFGPSTSYNPEELIETAKQSNLSYSAAQIKSANTTFESRSQGLTSPLTGNSQYMPIVSELEFLAETIDAIVPYSDVSYYNRDRQAERILEEIKQSNAATQKYIQEQTQAIKADKQVSVQISGYEAFKGLSVNQYKS